MEQPDMPQDAALPISISGVTKTYGPVHALDNVDLEIKSGEFMTLLGPSGSGKTTVLNLLGGLTMPTRGRVWVGGEEISAMNGRRLARLRMERIGFVFQAYNLIPVLTALENVSFVMLLQGVGRAERQARATELLKAVGLHAELHRRPGALSGGQQQRVFMARALAQESDILLLDEPFAGVDAATESAIVTLLRRLREKGRTVLVVHHDLQTAPEYFDHCLLLNMRIVAYGPTTEVFNPQNLHKTYGGRLTILEQAAEAVARSGQR